MTLRTALAALLTLAFVLSATGPADAQSRRMSHCIAIANSAPGIEFVQQANWRDPAPEGSVRINYLDHSMFMIRAEDGLGILTDYNGRSGSADAQPDVVTMNRAHSTHWTDQVAGIPNVLRGWSEEAFGTAVEHRLELGETLIRNVTTDIRSFGTVEENGNSIFVFETANLCIAHLGHLHQEPTEQQYAALGRVDVLMVPVDGSYTMDLPTMMNVVRRLQSSVVIPMHWFSSSRLDVFLAGMSDSFDIRRANSSEVVLSLPNLPDRPTVLVLDPAPLE